MTAERGNMVSLSAGVIQMTTLEANVILAHLDSAILAMDATLSTVTRLRADILGLMPVIGVYATVLDIIEDKVDSILYTETLKTVPIYSHLLYPYDYRGESNYEPAVMADNSFKFIQKAVTNLGGREPLILIHGWQGDNGLNNYLGSLSSENMPENYFKEFLAFWNSSSKSASSLRSKYKLYVYKYPTFEHVVELIRTNRDVKLLVDVETGVRLVSYQPGRIEFTPTDSAPSNLAARLGSNLQNWTGSRWAVAIVSDGDAQTIAEKSDAAENALRAEATSHPLVQAVLEKFPKAKITRIRTAEELQAEIAADALPEVEDEWDPFEDG